jgi:hypothetical protein
MSGYIAVGHNTVEPLNPFGSAREKGERIRRHPDKLVIGVRSDARELLARDLWENLGEDNPRFKYSDVELDSMSWLESNSGEFFNLAAGSISEWHDDRYYWTMPVPGVKGSVTVNEVAASTGGLLLPMGFCFVVHDPY